MTRKTSAIGRRGFNKLLAASTAAVTLAAPFVARGAAAKVVVVGGGFGGATAAKYLRRFDSSLSVELVEPNASFVTCPFSNTVIGGLNPIGRVTHGYQGLRGHGVVVAHDTAAAVDADKREVRLAGGARLAYDRLIVSPGIDFKWGAVEGAEESIIGRIPHAWKAGAQTTLLRRQLEAMPDGGVFVISPPVNPFRCPPGPGERISLAAHYFKTHKPRSKILVLDPKEKFSKEGLFRQGWAELYGDMIEYRSLNDDGRVVRVDAASMTLHTDFDSVRGDVINFIPPQRAGRIAQDAGLTDETGWCPVHQADFESALLPGIHVIGDASIAAPMPKSGFAASTQAKVCAAAIVAKLRGEAPGAPKFVNTCYSLVAPDYGISVAAVYNVEDGKIVAVEGAGGLSPMEADHSFRQQEADYARGWYDSITQDIFA
ncbi:FCSD flavin-binding domain-containing protein [Pelagibius sp. CAU 1746]|uniref:FCSD flavin-binding domain-containing protein n=1 Tax=Pelagibius sp. CAU 1746 TaxID=3140370 RepID=UPI00325BA544